MGCDLTVYLGLGAPVELASLAMRLGGCQYDTRPSFTRAEHLFVTCEVVLGCFPLVDVSGSVLRHRGVCVAHKTLQQSPPSPLNG